MLGPMYNLKKTETIGYFYRTEKRNNENLPSTAYPCNGRVGVNHAAKIKCCDFSPNGRIEKQNKG